MERIGHKTALLIVALLPVFLAACTGQQGAVVTEEAEPALAAVESATPEAPAGPAPEIDEERAMQYVREVVEFGPRPPGSAAHSKLQEYLRSRLKGVDLEEDPFTPETPAGKLPMRNFIAKFPGKKDGIIVVGGHYETKYDLPDFVGANDGGSSAGLLLELAQQLRGKQREGYSVWLVWFDGEEAIDEWSARDSLYGSRHLAKRWNEDGTLEKVKAVIIVDMVGDRDLNIERDSNSTPWLSDLVYRAAERLGYQSYFFGREMAVEDDHIPFLKLGVPAVDLIDFDYGYRNVFHHSPQDTLDKLSPRSLKIVGETVLETIRLLDQR